MAGPPGVNGMLSCCTRAPPERSHTSRVRRSWERDRTYGGVCAKPTGGVPNAKGLPRGTPAMETTMPTASARSTASPLGGRAARAGGVVASGGRGHTSVGAPPLAAERNETLK